MNFFSMFGMVCSGLLAAIVLISFVCWLSDFIGLVSNYRTAKVWKEEHDKACDLAEKCMDERDAMRIKLEALEAEVARYKELNQTPFRGLA